jgi:hypothetical protein
MATSSTANTGVTVNMVASVPEAILKIRQVGYAFNEPFFTNIAAGGLDLVNRRILLKTLKDHIILRALGLTSFNSFALTNEQFLATLDPDAMAIFVAKLLYELDARNV